MIHEFPPEILAHIFDFSTFDPCPFGPINQAEVLTTLSAVCRYWHQVLLDHPHFWNKRRLQVTQRLRNEPDPLVQRLVTHLRRWFGRAGDFHLNLSISFEITPRETKALYNYLIQESRWRALEFVLDVAQATNWTWLELLMKGAAKWKDRNDGRCCWPNLQSLTIRAEGTMFMQGKHNLRIPLQSVAPDLQKLVVCVGHLEDPRQASVFASVPWGSLRHFEFHGTLPGDDHLFWHFHVPDLTKAKSIETMVVSYRYAFQTAHDMRPPPLPTPIVNYSLTRLTLRAHFDSIYPFLSSLVLPSLSSLDLSSTVFNFYNPDLDLQGHAVPTPLANGLRALVSRSQCQIKELSLRLLPGHANDLLGTMVVLPALEYMKVDMASLTPEEGFFSLLQEASSPSRIICPNLQTFTWRTWKHMVMVTRSLEEEFALFRRDPLEWHRREMLKPESVHFTRH